MAAFNKFYQFVEDEAEKVHNMGADDHRIVLVNSPAPVATNTILANLTQIAAGFGYATGGSAAAIGSSVQTTGTYKLVLSDVVFTAAGGSIGPFRYAVWYNNTPTSPADPLVGWWDYGSSITVLDGETFTVDFDAALGVITKA